MKKIASLFKFKNENKVLLMLAFFSISVGLWDNFRQLWLESNNLNVGQIGSLLSMGTILCAVCALFVAGFVRLDKTRGFIGICFLIKAITLLLLYFCNHSNNLLFLKGLIIIDVIVEQLAVISVYPFLVTIRKDNTLYSKRKLIEYLFKDIGILIGGLFVGRIIFGFQFDYNTFLFISLLFVLLSLIALYFTHKTPPITQKKENLICICQKIGKDQILKTYFLYYFIGNTAYSTALGLKMLIMTNIFDFSVSTATNYFLLVGLAADVIGILCLKYFTPKSDYITISIKFGFRFLFYLFAFLTNNYTIMLIAITWSLLISTAYENVTDAPYVNRMRNTHQLVFTYIRYVVGISAKATGLFLSGMTYFLGLSYMLGLSAFLMMFQLSLGYWLIYLRTHEKNQIQEEQNALISSNEVLKPVTNRIT